MKIFVFSQRIEITAQSEEEARRKLMDGFVILDQDPVLEDVRDA